MSSLDGKTALITGAKGGLGSFVTEAFLAEGATVIGSSRSIQNSDFPHPKFYAIREELSDGAAGTRLVAYALAAFPRIHTLVHVVGGFAGGSRVDDTGDDVFANMLNVNYRAAFYVMRAVLPHMRQHQEGRILAVASRQGVEPAAMVGAYSASKAALVSLVHTIALENRDQGICANSVLPATMDTPINRAAMPGQDPSQWVSPKDVAALLVHLASDAGSAITGAAIPVYGKQV